MRSPLISGSSVVCQLYSPMPGVSTAVHAKLKTRQMAVNWTTLGVDTIPSEEHMSLKDEILDASRQKPSIQRILDSLNKEDKNDLEEILADPEVESTAIARVLRRRGLEISERTIQRHRQRYQEELNG